MKKQRSFRPLPFLGNPHVQTVLANAWAWSLGAPAATVRTMALPDGDALALHESIPPAWQTGGKIAVLIHGLAGCHRSGYMLRLTKRLTRMGVRVTRLDLRGAGAGMKLARRFYCAACSEDVRAVLEALHREHPTSPLLLFGFSLGGNIVLKLAGEAAQQPVAGLVAVAAVGPPIDLERCSDLITRQRFYDQFYARQLIAQVREHANHFPDLPPIAFPHRATLREFDDHYTAPRWGYRGASDYYQRASVTSLIPAIRVPCLILTSRDDPFIALDPFLEAGSSPSVTVQITTHGGHLGYLGHDGQGGLRWAETRVVEWALEEADRWQCL